MSAVSLYTWLHQTAARDALLSAWHTADADPVADYEHDALALAALATRADTPITIGQPSGRARLPLLAAVHAAALQLPGYPSPFTPHRRGPVVLATRQVVRRAELLRLDAAGVPISPALHSARVRSDGLCVPLNGGRPRPQDPDQRLLVIREVGSPLPVPPVSVIIDGVDADDVFIRAASQWAREQGATWVIFDDAARRRWSAEALVYSAGWAAINASPHSDADSVGGLASRRGYAAVIDAGPQPNLAAAAALFADARRRGPFPPSLIEAATLWRRLDELVVPIGQYDAACPRWHTSTLSERLDDLTDVRASHFPRGWGTWAEMCWAGIKEGLASARSALNDRNAKALALVDVVDRALRASETVDIALPSRIARDAVLHYLAAAGVVIPLDGRLMVRSLGDVDEWGPPSTTLLAAPPTWTQRHRLTAADIGSLNVLCYLHEIGPLTAALRHNLNEPIAPIGPITDLLPPVLQTSIDLRATVPDVVITSAATAGPTSEGRSARLLHFADGIDAAGLAALTTATTSDVEDLPGDHPDDDPTELQDPSVAGQHHQAAVPLTVIALGGGAPRLIHVPVQRTVLRILADRSTRIPVLEVQPGMLLTNLDGLTAFERLRPLLIEARGPVSRMLLAAWDQALEMALRRCGDTAALTRALNRDGSGIGADAVAQWSDADRIGPRDPDDVARTGRIAGHPVVAVNSAAIADVMHRLRLLHQAVGRALGGALTLNTDTSDQLETLLGADAVSIVNETVIYRVASVGAVTMASTSRTDSVRDANPITKLEHQA